MMCIYRKANTKHDNGKKAKTGASTCEGILLSFYTIFWNLYQSSMHEKSAQAWSKIEWVKFSRVGEKIPEFNFRSSSKR